jgi:hypothetical protein
MKTIDLETRFFGRKFFSMNARKQFQEEWSKMTDAEKLKLMNKKVEGMCKDPLSVEAIDARCKKWMEMTSEEKDSFLKKRKDMIGNLFGRHSFHRNFNFEGQGGCTTENKEEGTTQDKD